MASSSGTLRFADKVSLEEFPKGRENENIRKTTDQNIGLLKEFLMLVESFYKKFPRRIYHTSANERTTN